MAWWVVALGIGAVLGYVVLSFLGTVLLGLFVYYATRPLYARIRRVVGQRTVAAAVALAGIALPGLLLLGYTVVVAVRELRGVAGANFGGLEGMLGPYLDTSALLDPVQLVELAETDPRQLLDAGGVDTLQGLLSSTLTALGVAANALIALTIVLVVAFYLLRDGERLARWFRTEIAGEDSATVAWARAVDRDLETIYFGNILTAFVIAVVASVTYHALDVVAPPGLGVPAPTLLGLLTGLASLVPVVGMKVVYFPVAAALGVEAATADPALLWFPVLFAGVTFAVVDSIPEFLLRPYVSGRDLHLGLVMLAYIVGPALFGWYGLFLGPLLLVVAVHFAGIVLPDLAHGDRGTALSTASERAIRAEAGAAADTDPAAESRAESADAADATPNREADAEPGDANGEPAVEERADQTGADDTDRPGADGAGAGETGADGAGVDGAGDE